MPGATGATKENLFSVAAPAERRTAATSGTSGCQFPKTVVHHDLPAQSCDRVGVSDQHQLAFAVTRWPGPTVSGTVHQPKLPQPKPALTRHDLPRARSSSAAPQRAGEQTSPARERQTDGPA